MVEVVKKAKAAAAEIVTVVIVVGAAVQRGQTLKIRTNNFLSVYESHTGTRA